MRAHQSFRWLLRGFLGLAVLLVTACAALPRGAAPVAAPPFAESRWTGIDGVAWHWRHVSPAEPDRRCVVVLVHGFAGSTYSWRAVLPRLAAAGHEVVAVDLPGFGYSARTLPRGDEVAALAALLESGPARARPWCLVGHSMGAAVVSALAAARPERVAVLVLVDGLPAMRADRSGGGLLALRPLRAIAAGIAQCCVITRGRVERLLADAYGRPPSAAEVAGYLAPLKLPGTARAILDRGVRRDGAAAVLPETVPVVLIWGEADRWIPLARAKQWQARNPRAELVVLPGVGHNPMETAVDPFMAVLLARLAVSAAPAAVGIAPRLPAVAHHGQRGRGSAR